MSQNTGCTTCGTSWFWVLFGKKPNLNFESQAATSRRRKVPNNSQIVEYETFCLESLKSLLSKTLELKANTTVSVVTLCVSCSNPAVQVEAVENGALQTLLTTLATAQQLRVQKKVSTPTHSFLFMFRKLETTCCTESLTKEGNSTCLGL